MDTGPPQRGTCPVCQRSVALGRRNKKILRHGVKGVWPPTNCDGSGENPV